MSCRENAGKLLKIVCITHPLSLHRLQPLRAKDRRFVTACCLPGFSSFVQLNYFMLFELWVPVIDKGGYTYAVLYSYGRTPDRFVKLSDLLQPAVWWSYKLIINRVFLACSIWGEQQRKTLWSLPNRRLRDVEKDALHWSSCSGAEWNMRSPLEGEGINKPVFETKMYFW